jgi:hypothetical protein
VQLSQGYSIMMAIHSIKRIIVSDVYIYIYEPDELIRMS